MNPDVVRPLAGRSLSDGHLDGILGLFEVLADGTRLRILHSLSMSDELCVCDIAWLVGQSVSGVSHQLRLLRERGVVARKKVGRVAYYSLADEHVRHVLADAVAHESEPRGALRERDTAA